MIETKELHLFPERRDMPEGLDHGWVFLVLSVAVLQAVHDIRVLLLSQHGLLRVEIAHQVEGLELTDRRRCDPYTLQLLLT